jgi:hypothetical protein
MYDPLGGFYRIREQYLTYLETAFRIGNPSVSAERRHLLLAPGQMCTEPLVEPLTRYQTVDWPLEDLASVDPTPVPGVSERARYVVTQLVKSGLFDTGALSPYLHQMEMMRRGTTEGRPGIVTSGTGSGKTESFLLPILARIVDEGLSWNTPGDEFLQRKWWHDPTGVAYDRYSGIPKERRPLKDHPLADPFVSHRTGEDRPAAMRSLILYPMNALVEDQLARVRHALDSPAARSVLDEQLAGNRIFFGRYTSETPVTGFNIHPRIDPEADRSSRTGRLQSLFDRCVEMERTQLRLRSMIANGELEPEDRYLFPSVDGAELVTRWDIQRTPPDILISNISMLGAMLNREVDAPIFDITRQWLDTNDDAYFYLVLDELHLHRGTSGTEVAYLIRLLLHRLGLTEPGNRHKLRILASSASLPTDGADAERSWQFLWDMFGGHGTWNRNGDHATGPEGWAAAIVTGEAEPDSPRGNQVLPTEPFERLIDVYGGGETTPVPAEAAPPEEHEQLWRDIAGALGVTADTLPRLAAACIAESGKRVAAACWSEADRRARAMTISNVAESLFDDGRAVAATRGILIVRGLGDAYRSWYPDEEAVSAPSFRVHTFFRAIEGLYASVDGGASADAQFQDERREVGRLSIERSLGSSGGSGNRVFDILYCESCGELMIGGRRRVQGQTVELMPTEADLESLPDSSGTDRFEDYSFAEYAVFYPTDETTRPDVGHTCESWNRAALNPRTGETRLRQAQGDEVGGWRYNRTQNGSDRHHRTVMARGTNVPYQCPSCRTDYSFRRAEGGGRLSPIRHFRPGFAKTTQLLASELFDLLRLGGDAKLVSFSDSRQEAARAALDIESRHHEDLRRLILVGELRRLREARPSIADLENRIEDTEDLIRSAVDAAEFDRVQALSEQLQALRSQLEDAGDPSLPLSSILEDPATDRYRGARSHRGHLSPLLRTYAALGIHPFDPSGIQRIDVEIGEDKRFYSWTELFDRGADGAVDWRDRPTDQEFLDNARQETIVEARKLLTEVIFSKTYFALEETGLGYPCMPRHATEDQASYDGANALLRVFGDAYRLANSPYDDRQRAWLEADDIGATNKVRKFAEEVWGTDWTDHVGAFLARMASAGHPDGVVATSALRILLTHADDPAWRCDGCSRVHLHRGVGRCTRCYRALPDNPTATAEQIADRNFVGRKTERAVGGVFRLHCEELTGQTDNGPERQRSFRDVLIPELRPKRTADGDIRRSQDGEIEYEDPKDFWAEREKIDLLAVTTTMEVGIDIGSLQAVLQANMPPQRFNYQQRVGRAGRRGQAFSMALTVCRTKSHDLHYFRDPHAITGDVPPPPFLARARPEIARRFLRKWWLNSAFGVLRSGASEWPSDLIRPPDIHGEFVPTSLYATDPSWRSRLAFELDALESAAKQFAAVLGDHLNLADHDVMEAPAQLIADIDDVLSRPEVIRAGLGHSLAEAGLLPMYGMPTRVRDLYTGARRTASGIDWNTIDRELDVAVHEFAPGSTIIKDKRAHLTVGFTGPLGPPQPGRSTITPFSPSFGEPFWMAECMTCRTWARLEEKPASDVACSVCSAVVEADAWVECREPLGFRTDFRPATEQAQNVGAGRSRSVQAESFPLQLQPVADTNLALQVRPSARTYRMNRGQFDIETETWRGFTASNHNSVQRLAGSRDDYTITDQWIDMSAQPAPWFRNRLDAAGGIINDVWLAAAKTTDVLLVAPQQVLPGLALGLLNAARSIRNLGGAELVRALHATSVRAAALSGSFILVGRSAMQLDVDPEEFDIIDPRVVPSPGGAPTPLLQFADFLVNGAGLCSSLGTPDPITGEIAVGSILTSIVDDPTSYPRRWFDVEEHRRDCGRACYQCLLRHSNQSYHGLLDWRLGMAFLSAIRDTEFVCGLDGDFRSTALHDWAALVDRSLLDVQARVPGTEVRDLGYVRAFRFPASETWAVVAHPLWDFESPNGVLRDALTQLGAGAVVVDSFTLDRRPWTVRDALVHGQAGPTATPREAATQPLAGVGVGGPLAAIVEEAQRLGAPRPSENYVPPGSPGAPIRFAWPSKKVCVVAGADAELDRWLVIDGWSVYGPSDDFDAARLVSQLA